MEFGRESHDNYIKHAIKGELLLLYNLGKTEEEVVQDVRRGITNITTWMRGVFKRNYIYIKLIPFL